MSLTREDLHMGLHRFATKHDLDRFATKQELAALREDTAEGFEATRRHIDAVAESLAAKIREMLTGVSVRTASRVDQLNPTPLISPSPERSE